MENSAAGITQISLSQFAPDSKLPRVFLSKILDKDKKLLESFVMKTRPNSQNYEDSWGYIIQATRYDGLKWYDPQTKSLIFFGRKSDTDNTLVIPLYFAEPKYLRKTVKTVQDILHESKTILKNVNPKEVDSLVSLGFRLYRKNEGWSKEARFDDQTFPQLIVNLKALTQTKGRIYHHLRKALRKNPHATIRPYTTQDKNGVLDIFVSKDGNLNKSAQERSKGMYFVSHAMYPDSDLDKFVILDDKTKEIIGFTAMSDISSSIAAFVTLLFKPGIKVAGVWGIYQTLKLKYAKGFKEVNFGGCETEGTFIFTKRTFRPLQELRKTHLVYE